MESQQTARPKLFIGIDIHKRSWKVHCSTDLSSGRTFSMPPDPDHLLNYVERHYPGFEVSTAYEAGCCGYSAHRRFRSYGWRSLVVNPADIFRRGKERHTKTDRIDAQLISRELKDGRLEGIGVPDRCREQLRSLFRRRNDLVKDMRQIKSYIKMQLLYYGVKVPVEFDNSHWSHDFRNWLDRLVFEYAPGNEVLRSRMRSFRFIDKEFRDVSTSLRRYTKQYYKRDYMLLRSIPGIGGIVASGILSELGDLRRFDNIKHLAGYVGLAPGIYQSGDMKASLFFGRFKNQLFLYHEEEQIHRDTDRCDVATVRFWNEGHRHLSGQRHHHGHFLQLETQVRGNGRPAAQRVEVVTGREQEAQGNVRRFEFGPSNS